MFEKDFKPKGDECKKKWKNLKDTFRKKVQTPQSKSTSGPAQKKWKFESPLEFIREVLPTYVGENFTEMSDEEEQDVAETTDVHQQTSCSEDDDRTSRRGSKRSLKEDPPKRSVEATKSSTLSAVLNVSKQTYDEMSDDHHFFLSLLPYVSRLDDLEKLQLRAKIQNCVLEALSDHEEGRKVHYTSDNEASSNTSRVIGW